MKKVLCLLYHRVNVVKDEIFNLAVSPEHFEEQMNYIKSKYDILRFEDDWEQGERDAVVVTFDDGYADNYIYALPILEKTQVPATIFISTGYVNSGKEYWWDEIVRLLTVKKQYPAKFTLEDKLYSYTWETDTYEKRVELIKTLHWLLKMEPDCRLAFEWFEQLRKWADIDNVARKENLPVSIEELKALSDSELITLGAHTVNHISLGSQTREQQEYEIGKSIRCLNDYIGKSVETFSFPFGSAVHYNSDTLDICRNNGIKKSATTIKKVWRPGDSLDEIPRVAIDDCELEDFIKCVSEYMGD